MTIGSSQRARAHIPPSISCVFVKLVRYLCSSKVNISKKLYFKKMVNSNIFGLLNDDGVEHSRSHQTFFNSPFKTIYFFTYADICTSMLLSSLLLNFLTLSVSIPAPAPDILSLLNAHSSNSTTTSDEHDHWSITAPFNLDRC